jgi:predicted nucleic acid-binding Zn ribbon protein
MHLSVRDVACRGAREAEEERRRRRRSVKMLLVYEALKLLVYVALSY